MTMSAVFLEVVLNAKDLADAGIGGRDEIEDPLNDTLTDAELGEVTGGGGGAGVAVIDVELHEGANFEQGLSAIRSTLRALKVPASTKVKRYEPAPVTYDVY